MREKTGNPEFNYILLCNKICGKSHSMMNMPVYVGSQEEFDAWKDAEAGNVKPIVMADRLSAPHITEPVKEETTGHGDHH
jgi:cytochrome c oxidase subunit 2